MMWNHFQSTIFIVFLHLSVWICSADWITIVLLFGKDYYFAAFFLSLVVLSVVCKTDHFQIRLFPLTHSVLFCLKHNISSDPYYIKFSFETFFNGSIYVLIFDLVNFQWRDSMFVNIAFHRPCDISLISSVSFSTSLAALFILITQTDLVYHQQFGLVYSRSPCLGDKLSSLCMKMYGAHCGDDLLNRHFTSWCWEVMELILICFPFRRLWGILVHQLLKELIWVVSTYLCWKIY